MPGFFSACFSGKANNKRDLKAAPRCNEAEVSYKAEQSGTISCGNATSVKAASAVPPHNKVYIASAANTGSLGAVNSIRADHQALLLPPSSACSSTRLASQQHWNSLMTDLSDLDGAWLAKLQHASHVLQSKLAPKGLVSLSAVSIGSSVELVSMGPCAPRAGSGSCDLGLPKGLVLGSMFDPGTGGVMELSSVERVLMAKEPLAMSATPGGGAVAAVAGQAASSASWRQLLGPGSVASLLATQTGSTAATAAATAVPQLLPPDWLAAHVQRGLRSFLCLPIMCGGCTVAGTLTLATPEGWEESSLSSLNPDRISALGLFLGTLLQPSQVHATSSLIQDMVYCSDIDQLTRALGMGAADLCAGAYYQTPICRVALIRQDADMAVAFEIEPLSTLAGGTPRCMSQHGRGGSLSASPSHSNLTEIAAPPRCTSFTGRGSIGTLPSPRVASRVGSMNGNHTPLASPAVASRLGRRASTGEPPRGRESGTGKEPLVVPKALCKARQSIESKLHMVGEDRPQHPRSSTRHSSLGIDSRHLQQPGSPLPGSFSSAVVSAHRGGVARGHALNLQQTLLQSAIKSVGGAAWISDCTSYVQEGREYLHDIVISKANRAVNAMVVAVGFAGGHPGGVPLLAVYCTFRTPQPEAMLQALAADLQEMVQLATPLTRLKLCGEVAEEWAVLHGSVMAPRSGSGAVGGSRPSQGQASLKQGPRKSCTDPDMQDRITPPSLRGGRPPEQQQQQHQAPSLRAPSSSRSIHPGSSKPSTSGSGHPVALPLVGGVSRSSLLQPSRLASQQDVGAQMDAQGARRPYSFKVESRSGFTTTHTGDAIAPIVVGVHEKLMQMQMSRLLYGAAQDHAEELRAIRVFEKIGEGGFAKVYRGRFHGLDVAVKIMSQLQPSRNSGRQNRMTATGEDGISGIGDMAHAGGTDGQGTTDGLEMLALTVSRACEVAVMFSVSHPNIIQVMTFFTDVHVTEEPGPPTDLLCASSNQAMAPPPPATAPSPGATHICLAPLRNQDGAVAVEDRPSHAFSNGSIEPLLQLEGHQERGSAFHHHSPPALHSGSIVICMELADMGTLWRAVRKGIFKSGALMGGNSPGTPPGSSWSGGHAGDMPGAPRMAALYHTLLEVALALRHLHSLNLVHCDLKAANVLLKSNKLDPRGFTCKLSDFGLVKLMAEDEDGNIAIPSDISSGTLSHMAPEIFTRSCKPTSAVDVYAFGIMMYEVVTGVQAYKDMPLADAAELVVTRGLRPQWPRTMYIPWEYRKLAEACWSTRPSNRPDAGQLVASLEALLVDTNTPKVHQSASAGSPTMTYGGNAAGRAGRIRAATHDQVHFQAQPSHAPAPAPAPVAQQHQQQQQQQQGAQLMPLRVQAKFLEEHAQLLQQAGDEGAVRRGRGSPPN